MMETGKTEMDERLGWESGRRCVCCAVLNICTWLKGRGGEYSQSTT